MKLIQKRFLLGALEFQLDESSLQVCTKGLMSESRHTIALQNLDPTPSFHRSAPPQWLVFSLIFGAVALLALYGLMHDEWVPDKSGFIGTFLIFLCASIGCAFVFYKRKVDLVLLHTVGGGAPVVFIHRRLPTEVHVQEFVQIIQERISSLHAR